MILLVLNIEVKYWDNNSLSASDLVQFCQNKQGNIGDELFTSK